MRHPAPLPLWLALVVVLGLVAGTGAAPAPVACATPRRLTKPRRGIRSCPPPQRPVNDSTNSDKINSKNDIGWSSVSQSLPKRRIISKREEEISAKKNSSYDLMIKPGDEPIKTWEDLKSKLLNEDFLGAEARAEVIRILLPPGKRNDSEESDKQKHVGERKPKEKKVFKSNSDNTFSIAGRAVLMASTYAAVAILASLIAWYALVRYKRKKSPSLTQSRRPSKLDTTEKDEILRTSKIPVPEESRVSIAAGIITARTDAAEKAHHAAARAAEQTSASQPLTPVGARVADKMEVAEAVASKRKSRIRLLESSSKVFGALPYRCKGIRQESDRSAIVLEGFKERDVPQRRHSIIGILRPDEPSGPQPERRRSLPDMKTLREEADEGIARVNTTAAFSQSFLDYTEESSDTTLSKEVLRISSKSIIPSAPTMHRGTTKPTSAPEAVRRSSFPTRLSQDSSLTNSSTEAIPSDVLQQLRRKTSVSIVEGTQDARSHVRRTSASSSSSNISKPGSLLLETQERRTSKTQHRPPFQRSRRGTLETVQSESMIITTESEADTPTSELPSSGSYSETTKGQLPRATKQPPLHTRSSSTARTSLSSAESADESLSKLSDEAEKPYVKRKLKDKAIKEALDNVEKLLDKITTPIVDSMRSAALSKRKSQRLSQDITASPDGIKSGSPTKDSGTTRSLKPEDASTNDKSEGTSSKISPDGSQRISEKKTVLPRLWSTETKSLDSQESKPKPPEDDLNGELPPLNGPDDIDNTTEKKPVLPRLWSSTDADADDTLQKSSFVSPALAIDPNDSESVRSSKRSSKFLSIFHPKSPSKLESKTKDTGSVGRTSNKSFEDKRDENTPVKHSNVQSPVYDTTSGESISGKSEPGRWNVVASTNSATAMGHRTHSVRSMKTKGVLSKTSFKSSRHKFPNEKRHGSLKRADGTTILPVSQATLQSIFSRKSDADPIISETMESDPTVQPEVDNAALKYSEGGSSTDNLSTDKYSEPSSSAESAVVVGSVLIIPENSEERMLSSSLPVNLSPNPSPSNVQRTRKRRSKSQSKRPSLLQKSQQKLKQK